MGERPQTRLSSKCTELGDLLLKLKAEGRWGADIIVVFACEEGIN